MGYPKKINYSKFYSDLTERVQFEYIYNRMNETVTDKKLVLYDDNTNSIDNVVYCIIHALGYNDIQAQQITLLVHSVGKCTIKTGPVNKLKRIQNKLKTYGLDVKIED